MTNPRLVCLGNLTIDDVVLPDGTERPGCTGGDALYACLAARLFEPRTEMVAPVGCDWPASISDQIRAACLSETGLSSRNILSLHNRVAYDADGGRVWTLYNGDDAFHTLSPTISDIPASYLDAEIVLILAMTLDAQIDLVAGLKDRPNRLIALDMQEDYICGNEERLRRMIGDCDIFMPSADEAQQLLGHTDWQAAARAFANLGPSIVVLKLGAEGVLVHERPTDRMIRIPPFPGSVVDTTGAGDSFCGGFLAALLQNRCDLEQAARAGAVAAAFAVSDYGADPMFRAKSDEAVERLRTWRTGS
ncbi:carbohydrate kinase family protein [Rhizobium sp. TRM95796]|uniref:carbohydrate kinase family protein n=1 Tax=Rhizobium sp. TRM95796 TaxID=2979862 RepID=UPI0021E9A56C|nr:carbohydrate kinase family protein [Rhizobium sp. TRM95796]MCV3768880.1 carbohydrate kinase family protein [Rhizobium sp. TRM95796]